MADPARIPRPRVRVSTLLLLLIIAALSFSVVSQWRREQVLQNQLRAALNLKAEAIRKALATRIDFKPGQPPTLGMVLSVIQNQTAKTVESVYWEGMPIYLDPEGLAKVGATPNASVKSSGGQGILVSELLKQALGPMGLDYQIDHGLLRISTPELLRAALSNP